MFSYKLPCGDFKTETKMSDTGVEFEPKVWEQRYCAALQILEDSRWVDKIKKIVDFGCSEMKLFQLMRRISTIEEILEVDIDENLLKSNLQFVKPFVSDYITTTGKRTCPLHVQVLCGSAAEFSSELQNTDAVIALELIEHVYDDVLTKIPINIFGYIQPKIAVFSTPNSDYNVIFTQFNPLLPNGFRHHDHKFEWTREEFQTWCLGIVEKYANYKFSLMGVGEPPEGHESVGYVSQIAIFVRLDMLDMPLMEPLDTAPPVTQPYKLLHEVDYPFYVETRSKEQIVWAEVQFEMHRCRLNEDNYDSLLNVYKMPLTELLARTEHAGANRSILDELILANDLKVIDDILHLEPEYEEEETDEYENFSDLNEPNQTQEEENWDT